MKQEEEHEKNRNIVIQNLPYKIDSEFVSRYFGALNQARLGLKLLDEFEDAILMNGLAGIDCSQYDFSELSQEEFECIPFDSETIFSEETVERFHPELILEKGKSFGLGLEELGLSGKGIHIAIMDQNCNPYLTDADIVDYTRIKDGKVFKEVSSEETEHMHGITTTSLLASKSCGVAKDSSVHFFSGGTVDSFVENIINYNKQCMEEHRESEMILVASRSSGDKKFEQHRDELRKYGCELVGAENFNENFGEFLSHGQSTTPALKLTDEQISECINERPEARDMIQIMANSDGKVRIPISRTYHQVGEKGTFKYQSSFSTSWGIPQVAGLLAVFKELDRDLTFEQFLEIAQRTSEGELNIVNPQGIYKCVKEMVADKVDKQPEQDSTKCAITKEGIIQVAKKGAVVEQKEDAMQAVQANLEQVNDKDNVKGVTI